MFLGDLPQRRKGPSSGVGKENIQPSFFPIDLRVEAVQIPKIGDVPCTPVTFLPIVRIACSNSAGRRPVI